MASKTASPHRQWTIEQIRQLVQSKFQMRPCWFQLQVALALYQGKDVVGCAPTGAGKTLSFWIPLLMAMEDGLDKMTIVMQELWKNSKVTARILNFIFDEGHCIALWGTFRKEYLNLGALRYLIPEDIAFYVPSATLPPDILSKLRDILRLRADKTKYILCSNDRPDIHLVVQQLVYPANGFKDLGFLIPDEYQASDGSTRPPKFVVFFDNTTESQGACEYLRSRLPESLRSKIKYFHATMTQTYREDETMGFSDGDIWGMCCTDAFGMGVDIPDIDIVVQFKATCDMCTLWQRFGRAARGRDREGTAILLVEKKNTTEGRSAKAVSQEKKKAAASAKQKAKAQLQPSSQKRVALEDRSLNAPLGELYDEGNEDLDIIPDDGLDEWMRERRHQYSRPLRDEDEQGKKGKGREVELGTALDDYINPHPSLGCRRTIPMLYFGNDKLSNNHHTHCDTTNPLGCERCKPRTSQLCCDLCNMDHFAALEVDYQAPPKAPSKSIIKPYPVQPSHRQLRDAIIAWRHEKASAKFSPSTMHRFGARMLLPDSQVVRIVHCAHYRKILTLEQLLREVEWRQDWAEELGGSLIELIIEHFPPLTVPTSIPHLEDAPAANSTKKRAPPKCGACGVVGHTRASPICTMKEAGHAQCLKEDDARRRLASHSKNDENRPPSLQAPPSSLPSRSLQALLSASHTPLPLQASLSDQQQAAPTLQVPSSSSSDQHVVPAPPPLPSIYRNLLYIPHPTSTTFQRGA